MENVVLSPIPLPDLVNEIVRAVRADKDTATVPQPEELLPGEEIAKLLHCSMPTLRAWRRHGYVQGYRIGNRVLYKRNEVLDGLKRIRTAKQARG